MTTLDEAFRLSGDEDCGVGIQCRVCDRGGAPVAYYAGIDDNAYAGTDVERVQTIDDLLDAAHRHLRSAHAE